MAGTWQKIRHHPFLATWLAAFLLVGGCFGVFQAVEEIRALGHLRKGRAALETGDFAVAREELGHCLKAWPNSAETHFLAARAARRKGDLADALRLLTAAEQQGWVPEAIELERALVRVPLGELPEVEGYLTDCVARDHPDSALILEVLAPAFLRNFQLGTANHYAKLWTESRPDSAAAWACFGAVAERNRNGPEAIAAYRRAVEAAPTSLEDRLRLVRVLLESHESTEAFAHLERLQKDYPDDLDVRRQMACCLYLRGESAATRPLLDQVLAARPNDVEALVALGRVEQSENRLVEAERWFRRAAEAAPSEREAVYPLVVCLRQNGKDDEARRWETQLAKSKADMARLDKVTKAAAASPRDPEPRCEAGAIFLRNGKDEEALRWLVSALRQDPNHPATHRALAEYYERKGQKQQAAIHRARADRPPPAGPTGLPR